MRKLVIGKRTVTSHPDFFNGSMDDVRFYNRTLSKSEVSAIYNSGDGTEENGSLSSYGPLEGIGQQLIEWTDSRGTVHNIALTTTKAYHLTGDTWLDITPAAGDFTGSASNLWSYTTAHDATNFSNNGGSALVISNGKDKPFYYEGQSGAKFVALGDGDFPVFHFTNDLIEFWNHLFYINYNNADPAVQNVKSFVYADLASVTDWLTGTSGDGTLTDSIGQLLRAIKLGTEMIMYSENSITRVVYVGGDTLFAFPTVVTDRGLFASNAVIAANGMHYLLGNDERIYEYESSALYPIGEPIEDNMFSNIDASKKEAIVVGLDRSNHRIYFFYPTSSDTYAGTYYCCDYRKSPVVWEYGVLNNTVRSICNYRPGTTSASYMTILTHDGYIYKFDEVGGQDDSTDIECIYETPDITIDKEENYFRINMLTFNAMSTIVEATIDIYYSTNGGSSWTAISTNESISSELANKWQNHRIPIDINARKCRFKFTQNSAKDIQFRSMHCSIEQQTERN